MELEELQNSSGQDVVAKEKGGEYTSEGTIWDIILGFRHYIKDNGFMIDEEGLRDEGKEGWNSIGIAENTFTTFGFCRIFQTN